jgi:hypothetical protein
VKEEEHVDIQIRRTGKRAKRSIIDDILRVEEERAFPFDDHECMFEQDSERTFEYVLSKNPIVERLGRDEDHHREEALTFEHTMKPILRDTAGALEQRGEVRFRRYEKRDQIVWVIQVDRRRARFLDRIISDFIAFLKRTFNAV